MIYTSINRLVNTNINSAISNLVICYSPLLILIWSIANQIEKVIGITTINIKDIIKK